MFSQLLPDLRHALRALVARPVFTLVAVLSLALGIGVNTGIYSLYHQVVLRALPVQSPDALVVLSSNGLRTGSTSNNTAGPREQVFSYPMLRQLQAEQTPFEGIAGHRASAANVAFDGRTQAGQVMLVTGNYFDLLGLRPALGRMVAPHDDVAPGEGRVAVLQYDYWANVLGADPAVLGRTMQVNGQPLTVIGVAPPGFAGTSFGIRPQVFAPLSLRWYLDPRAYGDHSDRFDYWIYAFARLREGVSMAEAEAVINGPFQRAIQQVEAPLLGDTDASRREQLLASRITLLPGKHGQSTATGRAATPLLLLLAVAGLVLVVACLNIANLLLARGAARAGEMAVRVSLGAGRVRLMRQLLLESVLLALLGALASLPLAGLTGHALMAMLPDGAAAGLDMGVDPLALGWALGLALATVLVFGALPALQLARTAPVAALRGSSGQTGGSRAAARFRNGLAMLQVALSMASLVVAGLFLQSLHNIGKADLGMQVGSVAGFSIFPERSGYSPERSRQLFDRLETELAALPGVTAVASSLVPVLTGNNWGTDVTIVGRAQPAPADGASAVTDSPLYNKVSEGFFTTFQVPLLAGRDFSAADRAGAAEVAIVNRRFAEVHGLDAEAVGTRLRIGDDGGEIEIVGVVADSKYSDVREAPPPLFFLPRRQGSPHGEMNFYVRSTLDDAVLLPQLRQAVARLDADLPVEDLAPVPQQIARTLLMERFVGTLAGAFAVLATLLAALGLYGVLSFTLAQRTREIGLRLALGAAPARVRAMLLSQLARLTIVGALLGLLAALALGRASQSMLFGLQGHDPRVLIGALVLLAVVALAAGFAPARRAARVDPMTALRHE